MFKKSHVRRLIYSQPVKVSKTLLKSTWKYFWNIFWAVWNIVVSETLRLFVNILAPDDKYTLSVKANV